MPAFDKIKRFFASKYGGITLALTVLVLFAATCVATQPASVAPSPTPRTDITATATPRPSTTPRVTATPAPTPTATPSPTPIVENWIADHILIEDLGIDIPVRQSGGAADDEFPPDCCAFVMTATSQPGRGANSFIFAHALDHLFKPLWSAQLGQSVVLTMSDGIELVYEITEIHPNVWCPDAAPPNPELNPSSLGINTAPALRGPAGECTGASWAGHSDTERITLQTSQGYNRNWGELIIVAEPVAAAE